jgi:hypothetical protein
MKTPQQCSIHWNDALHCLESTNPCAFDYYYHFHYINGLKENALSPYERLMEIGEHSPCDCEVLAANSGMLFKLNSNQNFVSPNHLISSKMVSTPIANQTSINSKAIRNRL